LGSWKVVKLESWKVGKKEAKGRRQAGRKQVGIMNKE
jgi:hypothetical protein